MKLMSLTKRDNMTMTLFIYKHLKIELDKESGYDTLVSTRDDDEYKVCLAAVEVPGEYDEFEIDIPLFVDSFVNDKKAIQVNAKTVRIVQGNDLEIIDPLIDAGFVQYQLDSDTWALGNEYMQIKKNTPGQYKVLDLQYTMIINGISWVKNSSVDYVTIPPQCNVPDNWSISLLQCEADDSVPGVQLNGLDFSKTVYGDKMFWLAAMAYKNEEQAMGLNVNSFKFEKLQQAREMFFEAHPVIYGHKSRDKLSSYKIVYWDMQNLNNLDATMCFQDVRSEILYLKLGDLRNRNINLTAIAQPYMDILYDKVTRNLSLKKFKIQATNMKVTDIVKQMLGLQMDGVRMIFEYQDIWIDPEDPIKNMTDKQIFAMIDQEYSKAFDEHSIFNKYAEINDNILLIQKDHGWDERLLEDLELKHIIGGWQYAVKNN